MGIFVAGALGCRLVPLLVGSGHQATAMTRTAGKAAGLRAAGTEPVVTDALDRDAVVRAVAASRPEVVARQLTKTRSLEVIRQRIEERRPDAKPSTVTTNGSLLATVAGRAEAAGQRQARQAAGAAAGAGALATTTASTAVARCRGSARPAPPAPPPATSC